MVQSKKCSSYKKLLVSDDIHDMHAYPANLLKQKEKLLTNKIKLIAIFAGAHFQRKFMMIIHHSETVAFSLSFILFFSFFILYALCVCRWKSDYVSVFVSRKLFFCSWFTGNWQSKNKKSFTRNAFNFQVVVALRLHQM